MAGWPRELASRPASFNVTKAHNMILAGGASFNDGIFLAAEVVDRALKGSVIGERMNESSRR
jgi:hypothetical protein